MIDRIISTIVDSLDSSLVLNFETTKTTFLETNHRPLVLYLLRVSSQRYI